AGDPSSEQILRAGIKHRQETLDDQIVELGLELIERLGTLLRRDDRKVVGDLAVIENPLVGLYPFRLQNVARKGGIRFRFAKAFKRRFHRPDVVLRKRARVRSRISEDLVPLVERLRKREGRSRREPETAVGLTLQAGEVIEQRRSLGRGFGFCRDRAGLATAFGDDAARCRFVPDALGPRVSVFFALLEALVKPAPGIFTARDPEARQDFPVAARPEGANLLLAFDQDRKRRGL